MREKPILFSAPMVRALLAGTKTQTRRVMKPQPLDPQNVRIVGPDNKVHYTRPPESALVAEARATPGYRVLTCAEWLTEQHCPFGQPGDRLWVREAHWWFEDKPDHSCGYYPPKLTAEDVEYRADGEKPSRIWRPSIHMPRWASRITLEVEAVRVERLQDISEADARAEGCPCYVCGRTMDGLSEDDCHCFHRMAGVSDYRMLWESINGPGSWDANPWVWAITFRRITS